MPRCLEPFRWRQIVTDGRCCQISEDQVTRGQWADFIRTGAYFEQTWWPTQLMSMERMRGERNVLGGDALLRAVGFSWGSRSEPVTNVNWFEATAYCRWQQGRLPLSPEYEVLFASSCTNRARFWPWSATTVAPPGTSARREWCHEWWNERFVSRAVRAPDATATRRLYAVDTSVDSRRMDPCQGREDVGFRIVREDPPPHGSG